jgi:hypothetical protein
MTTSENGAISVRFNGHVVENAREVSQTLGSFRLPRFSCQSRGGQLRVLRRTESLFVADGVAKIMQALAYQQGKVVEVRGTTLSRLTADPTATNIQNPSIVELMQCNETALIRHGAGASIKAIALDIARAFPNDTIYFLTSSFSLVKAVAKYLRANRQRCKTLGRDRQYLQLPKDDRDPPRMVVVSTFGSVDPYHFPKSSAAVLLDAREITHQKARTILADNDELRVRLFGLLRTDWKLSNRQYVQMVGAFGLREVSVFGSGRQPRATALAMVQYQRRDTTVARKAKPTINQLYAANRERNTVLRTIAKSLIEGTTPRSRLYRELTHWRDETALVGELRVALVTENLPHALKLAKLLRQWPLVCASQLTPGVMQRLPESDRRVLDERRDLSRTPLGRQVICTLSGAALLKDFVPDVVIWAGGGEGAPSLPANWLECSQTDPTHLLIVDLFDGFHNFANAMSHKRESSWRDKGIYRVGTDPMNARFKRFAAVQSQL